MLFSAAATQSPIHFGPYLLTECVGQGGMAVVYKATRHGPSGFEKTVVVKAMLPALSSQREFVALFSAEARLMAALSHPNIVQVHDFGVVDGIPYLAMEYLAGRNLAQLRTALTARGLKLPVGAALAIAREMCQGLGYAHEFVDVDGRKRQIIHRDVSPSNVMVGRDGSVKLLDFGVAKIVGEFDYDVTQSFKGKYAYMAPEQVNHKPIDRRVDVFAAGVILHEMLTGKRLFAAQTELETLQRVSAAQVVAPSIDNHEVPRALDLIVKKALARDPGQRYMSGGELAEALETLETLAWPRRRLAGWVSDLFADEWMITCDVCGKAVMPSVQCAECGTAAPDESNRLPIDASDEARAVSARQALMPILNAMKTDRNQVGARSLPPLPTGRDDQPLPLPPPPPVTSRKPAEKARGLLSVVHTPLPPAQELAPPLEAAQWSPSVEVSPEIAGVETSDGPTAETALPSIDEDPTRIEVARVPLPPSPPKLFVVPRPPSAETPALTPLPSFATRRPSVPKPWFVVPSESTPVPSLRPTGSPWRTAGLGALVLGVGAALWLSFRSPEPAPASDTESRPAAAATIEPAAAPVAPSSTVTTTPMPTPAPTIAAAAPMPVAHVAAATPAPAHAAPAAAPQLSTMTLHVPPRRRAPRPHVSSSSRSVSDAVAAATASEPERTVKEGRIVDPFAGAR